MIKEDKLNEYDIKLIYEENNIIISYIIYRIIDNNIEITDVLTISSNRNKGYMSTLFNYLINKYNKYSFILEVNTTNIKAINLYKKFNFKEINIRHSYYKKGDAYVMKRKDIYILAIESSCDETSASIVKNGNEDISTIINSQIDVHKLYGGVVPEIASRMHLENITIVIDECLKKASMKVSDMDAIACTYAPGLMGSLLVGLEAAKTLSFIYNKPFIKVNHMMGHICANNIGKTLVYPLISLIISGGHTDLILMKDEKTFEYLGQTLDDAIGECYDKVARVLNIPYPGGPNVEALALKGKPTYKMPNILDDDSLNFSYSGIKSHIVNLVHNETQRKTQINKEDLACSFQTAAVKLLVSKSKKALIKYNIKNFCISGGVSCNNYIRTSLKEMCDTLEVNFECPNKNYCTDNATMIASAAYILYKNNKFSSLDTNACNHEKLDTLI
ncbi:MAG: tRNA (adenosine(37)-N6)-threonylcarbamoyltransferase complex transferase subunit TsaD [Bacilli bacterium]